MARVRAGDEPAFATLFDRYERRAYRMAYSIASDVGRAEEIVQEAFVAVWCSRSTYRPDQGTVGAWLITIVHHRAIDAVRRSAREERRRADEGLMDQLPAGGKRFEQHVVDRETAAQLRSKLAYLPAAQREVITLAYFGELSTPEIACALQLPLGTIKSRMRLGLEKLRVALAPAEDIGHGTGLQSAA